MPEPIFILIIVLAVGFAVVNGFNDAANALAASVGSRALSPRSAIILAAFFNLAGALAGTMIGMEVAKTIGKGIVDPELLGYEILIAALAAVIIWGLIATRLGLPVSISHSFIAGLVGAGIAGNVAVVWGTFSRVLSSVAIAPTLGFVGGFARMVILLWVFRRSAPARMRTAFSRLQWLTTAFLSFSHGRNDGQMPIAVITMALVLYSGQIDLWDNVPLWVIFISALSISAGTAVGGWRVIRTLGVKITSLKPHQGFVSDFSAAMVIEAASFLGIPVSTTHCASSAIMGVGATKRLSAVRWGVAGNIVLAWVLTFPICGAIGWLLASLF